MFITIEQNKETNKYRITKRNDDDEILETMKDLDKDYLEGLFHSIKDVLPELCV